MAKMNGKLTIIKKTTKNLIKEHNDYKIYTNKKALSVISAVLKCETRWIHPLREPKLWSHRILHTSFRQTIIATCLPDSLGLEWLTDTVRNARKKFEFSACLSWYIGRVDWDSSLFSYITSTLISSRASQNCKVLRIAWTFSFNICQ